MSMTEFEKKMLAKMSEQTGLLRRIEKHLEKITAPVKATLGPSVASDQPGPLMSGGFIGERKYETIGGDKSCTVTVDSQDLMERLKASVGGSVLPTVSYVPPEERDLHYGAEQMPTEPGWTQITREQIENLQPSGIAEAEHDTISQAEIDSQDWDEIDPLTDEE